MVPSDVSSDPSATFCTPLIVNIQLPKKASVIHNQLINKAIPLRHQIKTATWKIHDLTLSTLKEGRISFANRIKTQGSRNTMQKRK
jgi:hypothetical protein